LALFLEGLLAVLPEVQLEAQLLHMLWKVVRGKMLLIAV
jgi:hypothetical protein